MVGMTPWGVFFLACKLPYIKSPLLCQQTHFVSRWGRGLVGGRLVSLGWAALAGPRPHLETKWVC